MHYCFLNLQIQFWALSRQTTKHHSLKKSGSITHAIVLTEAIQTRSSRPIRPWFFLKWPIPPASKQAQTATLHYKRATSQVFRRTTRRTWMSKSSLNSIKTRFWRTMRRWLPTLSFTRKSPSRIVTAQRTWRRPYLKSSFLTLKHVINTVLSKSLANLIPKNCRLVSSYHK